MLLGLLGVLVVVLADIGVGLFAAAHAERVAIEERRPLLFAVSGLVAGLTAALLAVPANFLIVTYFGGAWSKVGWVATGIAAAVFHSCLSSHSYAEGRELALAHGEDWVNHIGEGVNG